MEHHAFTKGQTDSQLVSPSELRPKKIQSVPKIIVCVFTLPTFLPLPAANPCSPKRKEEPCKVIENFYSAEDREASEESHSSPNKPKLPFQRQFLVALYFVVGGRLKVDPHIDKSNVLSRKGFRNFGKMVKNN